MITALDRLKADNASLYAEQRRLLAKVARMSDLLGDCRLQLEYLNQKFTPTGTTNNILARIESELK